MQAGPRCPKNTGKEELTAPEGAVLQKTEEESGGKKDDERGWTEKRFHNSEGGGRRPTKTRGCFGARGLSASESKRGMTGLSGTSVPSVERPR